MGQHVVWWVRHDRRLDDNACLTGLTAPLLPVALLDHRADDPTTVDGVDLGFPRASARRRAFERAGLAALQHDLRALGSDLLVLDGGPEALEPLLVGAAELRFTTSTGTDEAADAARVTDLAAAYDVRVVEHWQHTALDPRELPFVLAEIPRIYGHFRRRLSPLALAPPRPAPPVLTPWPDGVGRAPTVAVPAVETDPRTGFPFAAGEGAARARLAHYLDGPHAPVRRYADTRNGLVRLDDSTRFSPWLAAGTLSPRRVRAELAEHEEGHGRNDSTEHLLAELLWRDFFELTLHAHGARVFARGGLQGLDRPWSTDRAAYDAWRRGSTGDRFVDAAMHEISATGWLSNRARQNAASYLVHDLGVDWRWGAAWFEHLLLDHRPGPNTGGWAYIAGVGNDPRPTRRFDTAWQAQRYDPDGAYRDLWA